MSVTYPSQRVAVLVDVQNMFYSAYDCFRGRLNYKKLLDTAAAGRHVVRALAYAMRDGNNQNSFFTMLREVGYELRTKEPRVRPDGTRKGGWDIGITIDALMLAPKVDVVALVSGDGDFVELVHALRTLGVRTEVYAFERSVGRELRDVADLFTPIGEEMIFRDARADAEPYAAAPEPAPQPRPAAPTRPPAPAQPVRTPPPPAPPRISSFGAGILNDEPQEEAPAPPPRPSRARSRSSPSFLDRLEAEDEA
ncbi:MAG TPA: NYN domain-containing protein [Planctomycetota bacterium]|nr:NYN domain-containing protein [Planctomycetota bacterium]HRR80308.1 NYN domain-containing protein [Planctomycetota bacterium]HRT96126.1 NYN domain-containing protein [Planctomycetota bacterium]